MAYGARLESVLSESSQGFESPILRSPDPSVYKGSRPDFFPVAQLVVAFLVLAGVLAAVLIPTYALTVERNWAHLGSQPGNTADARRVLRTVRFWVLTSSLALMSFSLYAVTLSAVPASVEKGMDLQTASWVLGLIGAGQVLGRLLYLGMPRTAPPWIPPAVVGLLGAPSLRGLPPQVTRSGSSQPRSSRERSVARSRSCRPPPSRTAGDRGPMARLNGMLAGPVAALTALAPAAAAILAASLGSYAAMGFVMAAVCAVGGLLVIRR